LAISYWLLGISCWLLAEQRSHRLIFNVLLLIVRKQLGIILKQSEHCVFEEDLTIDNQLLTQDQRRKTHDSLVLGRTFKQAQAFWAIFA
jgi:hypothetical protein